MLMSSSKIYSNHINIFYTSAAWCDMNTLKYLALAIGCGNVELMYINQDHLTCLTSHLSEFDGSRVPCKLRRIDAFVANDEFLTREDATPRHIFQLNRRIMEGLSTKSTRSLQNFLIEKLRKLVEHDIKDKCGYYTTIHQKLVWIWRGGSETYSEWTRKIRSQLKKFIDNKRQKKINIEIPFCRKSVLEVDRNTIMKCAEEKQITGGFPKIFEIISTRFKAFLNNEIINPTFAIEPPLQTEKLKSTLFSLSVTNITGLKYYLNDEPFYKALSQDESDDKVKFKLIKYLRVEGWKFYEMNTTPMKITCPYCNDQVIISSTRCHDLVEGLKLHISTSHSDDNILLQEFEEFIGYFGDTMITPEDDQIINISMAKSNSKSVSNFVNICNATNDDESVDLATNCKDISRRLILQDTCLPSAIIDICAKLYVDNHNDKNNNRILYLGKDLATIGGYVYEGMHAHYTERQMRLFRWEIHNLKKFDQIFYIADISAHYILFTLDLKTGELHVFDSLGENAKVKTSYSEHRQLLEKFIACRGNNGVEISEPILKTEKMQHHNYHCGVYSLSFLDYNLSEKDIDFSDEDMLNFRAKMSLDYIRHEMKWEYYPSSFSQWKNFNSNSAEELCSAEELWLENCVLGMLPMTIFGPSSSQSPSSSSSSSSSPRSLSAHERKRFREEDNKLIVEDHNSKHPPRYYIIYLN